MKIDFIPNKQTEKKLLNLPNDVMYKVARMTLDKSMPHIPKSLGKPTSGQLRRSSAIYGVRGSDGEYSIGSVTSYAKYVYVMPDSTNWTTNGTNGKWFSRTFERYGKMMIKQAIEQSKRG